MLRVIKYQNLESEVLSAENIQMVFQSKDNISLRLGIQKEKHTIDLVMPWNSMFQIGEYTSEQEARKQYGEYLAQLKQGYRIRITSNRTAEIIKSE